MKNNDSPMLILSPFPTEENIKDGMLQRIYKIDNILNDKKRIYLELSFTKNIRIKQQNINNDVTVIKANIFFSLFFINKILKKTSSIYVHSIYNMRCLYFHNLKRNKIILDIHGAVPEELEFMGLKIKSLMMKIIEKKCFSAAYALIYVNKQMKYYYERKYINVNKKNNIIYPIIPQNLLTQNNINISSIRKDMHILEEQVILLYAGNLQKWQNFEKIVDYVERHDNKKIVFIVLSNDIITVKNIIKNKKIKQSRIVVESVPPEQLFKYYSIAHYGFIVRDDHILNKVACPTKMIEYLYYGLKPIVLSPYIGDFYEQQYERIDIYDDEVCLTPDKSAKNKILAEDLIKNVELYKILDWIR